MPCRGVGQSVPHVHVHILPRHPGDFEPVDKVYDALEKVDIARDHNSSSDLDSKPIPHGGGGKQQGKAIKMDSERTSVSPCAEPKTNEVSTDADAAYA